MKRVASVSQHRFVREERHGHTISMTAVACEIARASGSTGERHEWDEEGYSRVRERQQLGVVCKCGMRVPNLDTHCCPMKGK